MVGRILFIDAYDSFSNNIVGLVEDHLSAAVEVIKTDDDRFVLNDDAFHHFLDGFDAVVAGPGPGHPEKPNDVGLIAKLWNLPGSHILPVLGVCLGFQSLALSLGATVDRLRNPRHGLITPVSHCGQDIFKDTGKVYATQYHSLHARISRNASSTETRSLWSSPSHCKELVPLAWDLSDEENGPILMGARHCHLPLWGVQYHPESICTSTTGRQLVGRWWQAVREWHHTHSSGRFPKAVSDHRPRSVSERGEHGFAASHGTVRVTNVKEQAFPLRKHADVYDIASSLRSDSTEVLVLESGVQHGRPINAETGRFSIISLYDSSSLQVRYSQSGQQLDIEDSGHGKRRLKVTVPEMFSVLDAFIKERKAVSGAKEIPFWGGFVGFISYEVGLASIDVSTPVGKHAQADVWFIFVERSVVIDHVAGLVHVQSIRDNDETWIALTAELLQRPSTVSCALTNGRSNGCGCPKTMFEPRQTEYCRKVARCQGLLRAGESYEICLTDTTIVKNDHDPWSLYKRLRSINPAPFGAFMHLSDRNDVSDSSNAELDVVSSSPERFLSWSRKGVCQFRPIKGTVKKSPGVDRSMAEKILQSPKEQAENLMIVDLIRHDLSGVNSATNVRVPKLMSIEEYETVYQLVSVVEGDLVPETSGISVLAASLPPGSMTGAPKKRSCQILREIEGESNRRGLYSGVIGYLDVGGGGDFSVVIRTAFKWSGEDWRIGAGGAVTALSTPEAEWEEMLTKRESVLRAFL